MIGQILDQKFLEISAALNDLQNRMVELEKPKFNLPYNINEAKITYAFPRENGKPYEERALDAIKNPKRGLVVHPDGSLTFDNTGFATTPNTDATRCELRWYKDYTTKKNFLASDVIHMRYGLIFHSLSSKNGCVFGQMHGESNSATFKLDAGKGKIRAHISRDEKGKDEVTLDFKVVPQIEKPYIIEFSKDGKLLVAELYDGNGKLLSGIEEKNIYREDTQYPKAGSYSRDPFRVTNFFA